MVKNILTKYFLIIGLLIILFDNIIIIISLLIQPNWSVVSDGQLIMSALTFRYGPKPVNQSPSSENGTKKVDFEQPSPQYVDTLNSWV